MTYPPAGPGQPHPHGPQPPGGYPPPGGWGPPVQPPPKKRRTGLWIGLAAGALIIAGILVIGFIMGFFLSGEDSGNAAGGSTSAEQATPPAGETPASSTPAGAGDPNDSAQKFVDALNSGDDATAEGMYCSHSDPTPDARQAIAAESDLALPERLNPAASYSVTTFLAGTIDGKQASKPAVVLVDEGGSQWCVSSFVVSTS